VIKAGATHKPGPHGLGVPIRSTQSPRRVDWDEYEFGNRVSGGNAGQEVGGWRVVRSADARVQASTMMGGLETVQLVQASERASVHAIKVIKLGSCANGKRENLAVGASLVPMQACKKRCLSRAQVTEGGQ
jgi:hypothetical protein